MIDPTSIPQYKPEEIEPKWQGRWEAEMVERQNELFRLRFSGDTPVLDILDASGKLIAVVYRYDPPGRKKEFRPWDARRRKMAPPDPRPLYNQPGITSASLVVLVSMVMRWPSSFWYSRLARSQACAKLRIPGISNFFALVWLPSSGRA